MHILQSILVLHLVLFAIINYGFKIKIIWRKMLNIITASVYIDQSQTRLATLDFIYYLYSHRSIYSKTSFHAGWNTRPRKKPNNNTANRRASFVHCNARSVILARKQESHREQAALKPDCKTAKKVYLSAYVPIHAVAQHHLYTGKRYMPPAAGI